MLILITPSLPVSHFVLYSQFFLSLWFILDIFSWSIFKHNNLVSCYIQSSVKTIWNTLISDIHLPFQKAHWTIFVDSSPSLKCSHFAPSFVFLLPYYNIFVTVILKSLTSKFILWVILRSLASKHTSCFHRQGMNCVSWHLCSGYCICSSTFTYQLGRLGWFALESVTAPPGTRPGSTCCSSNSNAITQTVFSHRRSGGIFPSTVWQASCLETIFTIFPECPIDT